MRSKIPSARQWTRNFWAVRQGPMVCELDGPTPILKISKVPIVSKP